MWKMINRKFEKRILQMIAMHKNLSGSDLMLRNDALLRGFSLTLTNSTSNVC